MTFLMVLFVDSSTASNTPTQDCNVNTNRNFIGIELDEGYFNIAKKRIYEIGGNYERLYN